MGSDAVGEVPGSGDRVGVNSSPTCLAGAAHRGRHPEFYPRCAPRIAKVDAERQAGVWFRIVGHGGAAAGDRARNARQPANAR